MAGIDPNGVVNLGLPQTPTRPWAPNPNAKKSHSCTGCISVSIPGIYPTSYQPKIGLEPQYQDQLVFFLSTQYQDLAWYEFFFIIFFFQKYITRTQLVFQKSKICLTLVDTHISTFDHLKFANGLPSFFFILAKQWVLFLSISFHPVQYKMPSVVCNCQRAFPWWSPVVW